MNTKKLDLYELLFLLNKRVDQQTLEVKAIKDASK